VVQNDYFKSNLAEKLGQMSLQATPFTENNSRIIGKLISEKHIIITYDVIGAIIYED
jgi:hypothetical protein